MRELLRQIGILDRNIADRLVEIYDRIAKFGLLLIFVLAINVGLNCIGIQFVSIITALVGTMVILYKGGDPWILLRPFGIVFISDKIKELTNKLHITKKEENEVDLLKQAREIYKEILLETILWFDFISLIIGLVPMQGRVKIGLLVVLALVSFKTASVLLKKPPIFVKVAYKVSLGIFLVAICWALLSPISVWLTGYDFRTYFQARPDREAMSNADEVLAKTESKRREKKINELGRIAGKRELTAEEKTEWGKLRKETSLLGKFFWRKKEKITLNEGKTKISLSNGVYKIQPADEYKKNQLAKGTRFFFSKDPRYWYGAKNGQVFIIPPGEKTVSIETDWPSVTIEKILL